MRIDYETFNSRFARRLFIFLFVAITLPVAVLSVVTVLQVFDHFAAQHRQQLHRETKQLGMSLFERIERISSELAIDAATGSNASASEHARWIQPANPNTVPAWRWLGKAPVEMVRLDAAIEDLIPEAPATFALERLQIDSEEVFVGILRIGGEVFAAPVDPEFLWEAEHLPSDQIICVVTLESELLFCNAPIEREILGSGTKYRDWEGSGFFEWVVDGRVMTASHWEVFLQTIGMNAAWTVVLSEPEQELLAPLEQFRTTLIIVVLAAMLGALLVSIGHIRRVLKPLQALHEATQEVRAGTLDRQVIVRSGDEFEELADSFNQMTGQLASQFRELETLAEIDQVLLSPEDSHAVIGTVIKHIGEILDAEMVALLALSHGEKRLLITFRSGEERSCILSGLPLLESLAREDELSAWVTSDRPDWLPKDVGSNIQSWSLVPLRGEEATDWVVAGWNQTVEWAEQELFRAVRFSGRVLVALTRARWQERLFQQAHFDDLTGLPNRASFKNQLQRAIERAAREKLRLSLVFIDLDRFKLINDSLGHAEGDLYLKEIASRIRECVPSSELVARLGGDEFTVAIKQARASEDLSSKVTGIIRSLLDVVPRPVAIGPHQLRSTVSIGVASFPEDGSSLDDLMKQADTAMYQAKKLGGDGYHHFASDMHLATQQRMEMESEMRHALEVSEFELHYQPQVGSDGVTILGAEVLLRWQHPVRGMVSPGVFIPIAEESMLIAEIDRWVLAAACTQIRAWLDEGLEPVRLSINISAAHFQQRGFVAFVLDTLDRYELAPECIELEITEGALIRDVAFALDSLRALRSKGIQLAIDDFGTGYCSLSYLKAMPIDKLKIDQSFIRDITRSGRDAAIVEVILQLSHQLGLSCIAEGVETPVESAWLKERGCQAYQGYLFYRPMPLGSFDLLLRRATEQGFRATRV